MSGSAASTQEAATPIPTKKISFPDVNLKRVSSKQQKVQDLSTNPTPTQEPNIRKNQEKDISRPISKPHVPYMDLEDDPKDSDSKFVTDETLQKLQESSNRKSESGWQRADRQTSPLAKVSTNNPVVAHTGNGSSPKMNPEMSESEGMYEIASDIDEDISEKKKPKEEKMDLREILAYYDKRNELHDTEIRPVYTDTKKEAPKPKKKKKSFIRKIFFCKCTRKDHEAEQAKEVEPHARPVTQEEVVEHDSEVFEDHKELEPLKEEVKEAKENLSPQFESEKEEQEEPMAGAEPIDEARLKRWIVKLKKLAKKQRQEKAELREALERAKKELKESEDKQQELLAAGTSSRGVSPSSTSKDVMDELDEIYAIMLGSSDEEKTKTLKQLHDMTKPERVCLVSKLIQDSKISMPAKDPELLLGQMFRAYKDVCPNEDWLMEIQWEKMKSPPEEQQSGIDPKTIDAVAHQEYDQICSNVSIPGRIRETIAYELMHLTRKKLLLNSYLSRIQRGKIFENEEYAELLREIELISKENEGYRENLSALVNVR